MRTFYHVTPYDVWSKSISKVGLKPLSKKRGLYADDPKQGRIYLFESKDTAEDAMQNWLVDEFPNVRWFALLRVSVPESAEIFEDQEIVGSYYVVNGIPKRNIKLVQKIDAGEPE